MLQRLAEKKLRAIRANKDSALGALPVRQLVPRLFGGYDEPRHMAPYCEHLDAAIGTNSRLVFAAPPQHGKTVCTEAALVKISVAKPRGHVVYATYNQDRSDSVAREVYQLCEDSGLGPEGPTREFRLGNGAHLKFTSIGGSLTGYPIDSILIIDDPIKDSTEAASERMRQRAVNWLHEVAMTRVHPNVPIVMMATRWHPDDPSGYAIKDLGWPYLNLRAVSNGPDTDPLKREAGVELWPEKRPLSFLKERMAEPYSWASLYQGDPRPREGKLFGEPTTYVPADLPTFMVKTAHGCDLAYAAKTYSDRSVLVTGVRKGDLVFLVDCKMVRCKANEFADIVKAAQKQRPGPCRWYCSTTERGTAHLMNSLGARVDDRLATADKHTRAQPVATAWNLGKVLIPSGTATSAAPEWVTEFLEEVQNFTGINDRHDDCIDALAAMYDCLVAMGDARAPMPTVGLGFEDQALGL